jgi:phosphomannomutase/phosphoglucomutase
MTTLPKRVAENPLAQGSSGDDIKAGAAPETSTIVATAPLIAPQQPPASETAPTVAASIFRSYDIRGIVGETLTPEVVYQIGRAFGAEAGARNQQTVIVARDGRVSSLTLRGALVEGLRDAGRDVLDIGLTPTPVLYFATHYLDTRTGVMVTGSHNPAQYNGLKMVLDGETLSGAAIQSIRERIETQDFTSGSGNLQEIEIVPDYIRRISEDIPVSLGDALKVVVDCGNGVPGIVAPHILRAIGHDVIELYCEVDGEFPNHHPDPSQPENLEDLIAIVRHEQADLGLAFDGDGDRLGVVDREGNIVWPDRQLMLFAQDVLSRNPGAKIIYDVKCSRLLPEFIRKAGGVPIMSKAGHSLIKQKMQETGALLAGEMSGHIFFKERWYGFDDALYSAARLLEILVNANLPPEQVFASLPQAAATPELRLDMPEERHAAFMQQVSDALDFPDGELTDLDGLRVDFAHSWGLIRPSNTTPCLVLRFEGDDEAALSEVKERFRTLLSGIDPSLTLPF